MDSILPIKNWRNTLSEAFTNIDDLCQFLQIQPEQLAFSQTASDHFPLRVPRGYAERIKKKDPNDPLLKQVLPSPEETKIVPGYNADPVGDLEAIATPGVIHKYHGRVLFIVTGHCAINCRYCFRKAFPYSDQQLSRSKQQAAMQYIQADSSITEVILSGGDPLGLSDVRLAELIAELNQIQHIKRIRIHTRMPIVVPERINQDLMSALTYTDKDLLMVTHCNHSNEIDQSVINACKILSEHRITLLNQTVLLKDINDGAEQLCQLSESLFSAGILPYYLHLLDKVIGSQHFDIDLNMAVELIEQVTRRLPGYLVPKLVREEPGAPAKVAVIKR